jgi:Polyketide cyclase / dehydrase and lipid transport
LRTPRFLIGLVAALAAAGTPASAASVEHLSVAEAGGRYTIEMRVRLDVPARAAYDVFANLGNLRTINSNVREAKVLGRGPHGGVELYARIRACVLWLCKSLRETQRMTFDARPDGGEVYAEVLPRGGDFREGRTSWSFRNAGGRTLLVMTAELVPIFRVPPIVGPWIVKRWLAREAERTARHLERLARAHGAASSSDARTAR